MKRFTFLIPALAFALAPLSGLAQMQPQDKPDPVPPEMSTVTPANTNIDFTPIARDILKKSQSAVSTDPGGLDPLEIKDIRPIVVYPDYTLWIMFALAFIAVLLVLYMVWLWFQNRPERNAKSAFDLTLDRLAKARALLNEEHPMPYAILISETIRTYLGYRFHSPSTRRTTEEFLQQMQADKATPLAEHRELLRHFLQSCDLVKFAKYVPTLHELEEVHQRAVGFVTATKPVPAKAQRNGRHP